VGAPASAAGGFGPGQPADELQLTDEQQTAIDEIRAALRDAIQARHEQARDEFLSLLTDEQLERLGWSVEPDWDQYPCGVRRLAGLDRGEELLPGSG